MYTPEEKEQLKSKGLTQFKTSYNSLSTRKDVMRERKKLRANIERGDDKIGVHTVSEIVNTLLSLYYKDKLTVRFVGKNPYTREAGEEWNNIAQNDYDEMDMETHDFEVQLQRFATGVGIRHIYDRDKKNNLVKFETVDTETWRPDPKGRLTPDKFGRMGFDRTMNIDELKSKTDLDLKPEEITAYLSSEEQLRMYSDTYGRHLVDQGNDGTMVTIYYHYMHDMKGMPVQLCYLGTELLSIKQVAPLAEMLKKENNMYNLKRPVSLNYRRPKKGDPFGICVPDIAEDAQKLKTLIFNLMKIKAVKQALGGTIFVDSTIYKGNKSLLENPTKTTKIIPVTGMPDKGISQSVYALPEDQVGQDSYNLLNLIDQKVESSSGVSEQTRGMSPEKQMTGTEVVNNQQNAEVNLLLANKVNAWGEKQFRQLVFTYYKHYFDSSSKKYVEVNRGYTSTGIYYTRDQLFDIIDPRISIENKSVVDEMNNKMIQAFQITFLQDVVDPTIPEISKRYLKRKYKRLLAGMSRQELDIIHPPSPEEMKAKRDLLLLNRNIPVRVRNLQESHMDFIIIYGLGLPTSANKASREERIKAYIKSGQAKQLQEAGMQGGGEQGGMVNSMSNQLVANSLQKPVGGVQQ